MTTSTPHITPVAIERAWRLAGAHGHHWAADARLLPRVRAEGEAAGLWLTDPESRRDACDTAYQWRSELPDGPAEPPRTREDAELLGLLPEHPMLPRGIRWSADADGVHMYTTTSGRTTWNVFPCGRTLIWVRRPSGAVVLWAELLPDSDTPTVRALWGPFGMRHLNALLDCLSALGVDTERSVMVEVAS
jgi:hypothetical protein